ncbi:MAG: DUF2179 domain-containing protein [Bacteroidales bacterium]|nr:DUF2179 domain-containing protein [Bacteroidales bacterium]
MFSAEFLQSDTFAYVVLPLIIFFARISDVTLGTLRIIFVSRGNKTIAPFLGFFEVLIWVIAISNIIQHLDNVYCYLAWASGFATGNFIGMKIEERLALGVNLVRIITKKEANVLISELHQHGYGATIVDAKGRDGDVHVIYTVVKRKEIQELVDLIKAHNPNAFYVVEDVRFVSHDEVSFGKSISGSRRNLFGGVRKGK